MFEQLKRPTTYVTDLPLCGQQSACPLRFDTAPDIARVLQSAVFYNRYPSGWLCPY